MELFTNRPHGPTTTIAAGIIGLAAFFLAPAPAHASRIPADPVVAFVPSSPLTARLVSDGHAANVRTALEDLRDDVSGAAGR